MTQKLSPETELKRLSKVTPVITTGSWVNRVHTAEINGAQVIIRVCADIIETIETVIDGKTNYWNRVKHALEAVA